MESRASAEHLIAPSLPAARRSKHSWPSDSTPWQQSLGARARSLSSTLRSSFGSPHRIDADYALLPRRAHIFRGRLEIAAEWIDVDATTPRETAVDRQGLGTTAMRDVHEY